MPASSQVELAIYNTCGQRVLTLVKGQKASGNHSVVWNAMDNNSAVTLRSKLVLLK